MTASVNVNGRIYNEHDAVIPVFDHGFLYGEGVYETLRTYDRVPFLLDRHLRRLNNSAGMIALPVPFTNDEFERRIDETLHAAGGNWEAYIRVLFTRGVGDLTYDPAACPTPSLVIIVKPLVLPPAAAFEEGVTITLATVVRNDPKSLNPLIKSNNLLNNALAAQEGFRKNAFEALMCNHRGELVECAVSNFFIVRDGNVLTPPLTAGLLAGITREFLFEIGPEVGIPVRESVLREEDLHTADEAFISSTTREIVPVVRVDDVVIGRGRPGPIVQRLLETFRRKAREFTQIRVESGRH